MPNHQKNQLALKLMHIYSYVVCITHALYFILNSQNKGLKLPCYMYLREP